MKLLKNLPIELLHKVMLFKKFCIIIQRVQYFNIYQLKKELKNEW